MADGFQYKLLNYELPPPESAWNNIVAVLDAEFDPNEHKIAEKLFDYAITPPFDSWQNILGGLAQEKETDDKKVFHFSVRRLAIAAFIIGLVASATWFIVFRQADTGSFAVKQPVIDPEKKNATPDPVVSPVDEDSLNKSKITLASAGQQKRPISSFSISANRSNKNRGERKHKITYADRHLVPQYSADEISITAPLIRDRSGKIILDVGLLTANNKNYITITGPNGEQTKISSKFLNMVSYLNDRAESEEYLGFYNENTEWKNTFQAWRNKLLLKTAFIPTTNSFLGIVDLKEMLEDK